MGSPFPKNYAIINETGGVLPLSIGRFREVVARGFPESVIRRQLNYGFGEDIHAADLGRHPELRALFFDPDDGSLTADPALLARGKFGWKDQHKFHVSSLLHSGLRIEKNSIGADVASMCCLVDALNGAQAGRNARGDSRSGAALGIGFHAGSATIHCTPMPGIGRVFPGSSGEPGSPIGTRCWGG